MPSFKPPKVPALSRATRRAIPARAGMADTVDSVYGFGPRKQKGLSASTGTNPIHPPGELGGLNITRKKVGLAQNTAPQKAKTFTAYGKIR